MEALPVPELFPSIRHRSVPAHTAVTIVRLLSRGDFLKNATMANSEDGVRTQLSVVWNNALTKFGWGDRRPATEASGSKLKGRSLPR
jgi:hypothetical protein